jgi:epoxide hydrolase-like predicted phosphatase
MFKALLKDNDPSYTIDKFRAMNFRYWRDMQNEFYSVKNTLSIEEYNSLFLQKEGFSMESSIRIGNALPEIIYQYELESTELMPGAMELLIWVRRHGFKTGVITNTAPHSEKRIRSLLRKVAIENFFDTVIVSSDVGVRKPDAEIFRIALSALKVEPHEALFIGDRYDYDAVGAQNAGMRWILLDSKDDLNTILLLLEKQYGT